MAVQQSYLSVADLCHRWRVDRRTLYKMLPSLRVVVINRRVRRIPLTAVERYEREQNLSTS